MNASLDQSVDEGWTTLTVAMKSLKPISFNLLKWQRYIIQGPSWIHLGLVVRSMHAMCANGLSTT